MTLPIRARLKNAALRMLGAFARRHVVILPGAAGAEDGLLGLRAPYRVEKNRLVVELTRATLRAWWAADARFRRLLAERDLGDLLTCRSEEHTSELQSL